MMNRWLAALVASFLVVSGTEACSCLNTTLEAQFENAGYVDTVYVLGQVKVYHGRIVGWVRSWEQDENDEDPEMRNGNIYYLAQILRHHKGYCPVYEDEEEEEEEDDPETSYDEDEKTHRYPHEDEEDGGYRNLRSYYRPPYHGGGRRRRPRRFPWWRYDNDKYQLYVTGANSAMCGVRLERGRHVLGSYETVGPTDAPDGVKSINSCGLQIAWEDYTWEQYYYIRDNTEVCYYDDYGHY